MIVGNCLGGTGMGIPWGKSIWKCMWVGIVGEVVFQSWVITGGSFLSFAPILHKCQSQMGQ